MVYRATALEIDPETYREKFVFTNFFHLFEKDPPSFPFDRAPPRFDLFVHDLSRKGETRREMLVTAICEIIREDDGGSSAGRLPVCHEETTLSPIHVTTT